MPLSVARVPPAGLRAVLCGWQTHRDQRFQRELFDVVAKYARVDGVDDARVYAELAAVARRYPQQLGYAASETRADRRVQELLQVLGVGRVTSYVDLGCADGSVTAAIARAVGATVTCGLDVSDCFGAGRDPSVPVQLYDGVHLPQPDGSVDLVTALMALHHAADLAPLVADVTRALGVGGELVIREHDCRDTDGAATLDLVHGMYALVWRDPPEDPDWLETHVGNYADADGWDRRVVEASRHRLLPVRRTAPAAKGVQRAYWRSYRKLASSERAHRSASTGKWYVYNVETGASRYCE